MSISRKALYKRFSSTMFPRIVEVFYIEGYCLELTFTNGEKAVLDFAKRIVGRGGVFEPLEDVAYFKQVRVDPEIGTLVWPNDVDFCPDVLYSEAMGVPIPESEIALPALAD